jgi:spectinomycin phosphotransferase
MERQESMLEKPNLPDEKIADCLRASYALAVAAIAFLPIGYDASAWAYRVTASDGQLYFLKVRRGTVHRGSAAVARYLKAHDVAEVVAPLPTSAGQLSAPLEGYTLLLYPWIEGRTGMVADGGLSDDQWIAYGDIVRRIHATRLPAKLAAELPPEEFTLKHDWGAFVRQLSATLPQGEYQNPHERAFAQLWLAHSDEIITIVEQAERLGSLLRRNPPQFVLCHADIHTANLLVTPDGALHVVDWDQPQFAPRERDLMFVIGANTQPTSAETLFFAGYEMTEVDALTLAYYRYEWCVQEFCDFAMRVFTLDDVGDETKADSVRGFRQLFAPGDVVEEAHKAGRMAWFE